MCRRTLILLLSVVSGCDLQVIVAERAGMSGAGGLGGQPPGEGGLAGGNASGGGGEGGLPERPVFGAPRLIEELSTPDAKDQDPTLTGDLLEIFFFSERGGNADLWTSRRADLDAPWEPPVEVEELNSAELEINPAVTRDGLELWFHSQREPAGIYHAQRASRQARWDPPQHVEEFGGHIAPGPSDDRLRMALSVLIGDADHRDIVESVRSDPASTWGTLEVIEGLNVDADDSTPFLLGGGLTIFFSSARSGAGDLYWTHRVDFAAPVVPPEPLAELNAPDALDTHPHLSPDGTRIFFGSTRSGVADLYEAERVSP